MNQISVTKEKTWVSDGEGLSRKDRKSCRYEIFIPDHLTNRDFYFSAAVTADISEAEQAITKFNAEATSLVSTEALARLLLRAECVASSKIEGLAVHPKRLLKAEAGLDVIKGRADDSAREILANIRVAEMAINKITSGDEITLDLILEVNKLLITDPRLANKAGKLRQEQNWVGGSSYNPCSADFVPPNDELVPDLMADLIEFCNQDDISPIAQAAIAHAQFETIHPFIDGNGRTGRVLIQMILRKRNLSPRVLPPVSLVLATQVDSYIGGLEATRLVGDPDSSEIRDGINLWVGRFAAACKRAVENSLAFEGLAQEIEDSWRKKIGKIRKNSSSDLLLGGLIGMPIVTVETAKSITTAGYKATNEAIENLVNHGILEPLSSDKRNRAFEAREMIQAFADLEERLTS